MELNLFFNQLFILGVLVIIGILAGYFKIITETGKDVLSMIIFHITLPLLILTGISNIDIGEGLLKNSLFVLVFSVIIMGVMWLGGYLSSKALHLSKSAASVHVVHTMFGNIVYLGFPLINVMYPGGEGLYYAILFHLVSSLFMWTAGVLILKGGGEGNGFWYNLKPLLNLNTLAFGIGFIFLMLQVKIPSMLFKPLEGLGQTTIYLSMLYIGAILAGIKWKDAIRSGQAYILGLNKLILIPIVGILLVAGMNRIFLFEPGDLAVSVIIIEVSMPCMANIVVLARIYGADDKMATQNVFITTILSIFTLPVIFYLLHWFL
jgi:predicted permease